MAPAPSKAIARINKRGALLVYPINNREEPRSLWSEFFPKTPMVWDWNEDGDDRVAGMWQLMKQLSDSGQVVYSKWYQGRATFFSRELFTAMLAVRRRHSDPRRELSETAKTLFEVLENNSPLSTKELKRVTDLQGRLNEPAYTRGMKDLFVRLLIVGFGEVEDGAFPSAAVGATELLFSDLWSQAEDVGLGEATQILDRLLPPSSHFRRFFDRSL
ncbi:MAG TPA: hypothetical protein VKY31_04975 [Terriglobia bacterium]|nr:hypothetical protein [Terriglobia bacterium]